MKTNNLDNARIEKILTHHSIGHRIESDKVIAEDWKVNIKTKKSTVTDMVISGMTHKQLAAWLGY